ncbi:MAG: hypothetical protein ACOX6V_05120 [Patescibacteria group bacterium]|jgi:hypothetical protein
MSQVNWQYLDEFTDREDIIASYLKGKTEGKIIVDLNCLKAPLLKKLEPDFHRYLGNDILPIDQHHSKAVFYQITDEEMARMVKRCDILVVMGYGGYEKTGEEAESKTLSESIERIVYNCLPDIVIIEGIKEFEELFSNGFVGYTKTRRYEIEIKPERVYQRVIYIFERLWQK